MRVGTRIVGDTVDVGPSASVMRLWDDRKARQQVARRALELRDDVLAYLGSRDGAKRLERLRRTPVDAWVLLLRAESCALPLLAMFRADGALDALDDECRARLAAAESRELQRVLAARLVLRELDSIADGAGMRATALKGGAIAADTRAQPLDLGDVDVLVASGNATLLWDALAARGWAPSARGVTPADGLGPRLHYAPLRSQRHLLPVELHVGFAYGALDSADDAQDRAPITGYRALDRLVGPRALAATLGHSVVSHPHRRGHLRDLFLLAALLQELDEREMAALGTMLSRDPHHVELLGMFGQARALAERDGTLADPPALRRFVAWKYATIAHTTWLLDEGPPGWVAMTHVPLERPDIRSTWYRRLWSSAFEPVPTESSFHMRGGLTSRLATSLGIARALRGVYRSLLVTFLAGAGGALRRHIRRLDRREISLD